MPENYTIADALFSATQQRVLSVLFGDVTKSFHLNDIVRAASVGTSGVQRELKKLETSGLVNTWRVGNQKHYQANRDSPVFDEIKSIVEKTVGLRQTLLHAIEPLKKKIDLAFIYGSVAKSSDTASSDIDVLIVSDKLSLDNLYRVLLPVENHLGRKINVTLYKKKEFTSKVSSKRGFLAKVLSLPIIELVGSVGE